MMKARPKEWLAASRVSIQRQLMLSFLLTTGALLVLTSAAFFATEYQRFRDDMVVNLTTLSRVLGSNTTASLRFDDAITLAARNAEISYEADNVEVWVPSGVGDDASHALWKVNGNLRISARDLARD